MKRTSVPIGLSIVLLLAALPLEAARPAREILGVTVGMSFEESQERLERVGRPTGGTLGPLGGKQVWELDDATFSHAVVRYKDQSVEWITAFARKGGDAVGYGDFGDLKEARLQGKYFYSWSCPAGNGHPACVLRASGTDPERVDSVSLYRLGSAFRPGQK